MYNKLRGPSCLLRGSSCNLFVELKSVDFKAPVHESHILTHMKFSEQRTGLLINYNVTALKYGIKRYVL